MPLTVLLTNDDGPPDSAESPYVLGLYRYLTSVLGWNVKVVLPSSQKSWIGKAYHIKEVTKGSYFYPNIDGRGDRTQHSRPIRDGEIGEWILLDATPATCANVALHNIFPGQIDMVISGPNLGRNTSAAFALSSGTIGAALSASLSKVPAIALSYGTVLHPTPPALFEPAHDLGSRIIKHLWENWGEDSGGLRSGQVDLYSVNIPLIEGLLADESLTICWTTMWRNSYGRLFKNISAASIASIDAAGPDSLSPTQDTAQMEENQGDLVFKFAPEMKGLITPSLSSLPEGSDGWAIHKGWVSVTPLRASFGEPPVDNMGDIEERVWKMRL
ncbi:survival protein sure-like phosphatase/nucleotidase [Infundibulicybe gibba]|nr:survival protein sure-like phosphatase/nucleotidase [Infundibulicybe gibba]